VIINADDLGYSESTNAAIDLALTLGRISSATLMVNAPATGGGLAVVKHHPASSFGIHLNLTEFAPLSDPEPLRALQLLDQRGCFAGTIRDLPASRALRQACFNELDAQIRTFRAAGLRPSHLDSHHHIHTIPWMLPVMLRLQRRHGIPCIRNTMNVYPSPTAAGSGAAPPPSRRLHTAKTLWTSAMKLGGGRLTDVFTCLEIFLADPARQAFLGAGSIELMCHPGQQGFEAETARLFSPSPPLLDGRFRLQTYSLLLP
jgi:predicted glycoside hydrolase/deacetylase ChbG (UPF0249 family)